jgi:prevent-host-death family protein
VRKARNEGPQMITLRGRDAVVVLEASEFKSMAPQRGSLAEFLRTSPLAGVDVDLRRSRDRDATVTL